MAFLSNTSVLVARPLRGLFGGVIEEARGRQRRQRAALAGMFAAAVATALLAAFQWGGAGGGQPAQLGGSDASRPSVAARDGAPSGRVLSSLELSLVEPAGWFGRTQVLPVGGPGAAWLQTSNFSLRIVKRGLDPLETMGANDVVVTITTAGPFADRIQPTVQPLEIARDAIPARMTPRHYLALAESASLDGGLVSISVWFGSRSAAPRLLPVVNRVLGSLHERPRY
jgi:hypothetical protein